MTCQPSVPRRSGEMVFTPSRSGVKDIRIIMKDGKIYKNTLK
jgi:hypothetical protein